VWWAEQPRAVLHQFLAVSTRVFCSADSMSMLMESVSAMRPVVAYLPEHWQPDEKFHNVLERLSQQEILQVISIAQINSTFKAEQQQTLTVEPSEMLAQQLHKQLFANS
jgi:mitochondrial fission protein ELM1